MKQEAIGSVQTQRGETMRLIDANELKTAFPCGESVRTESVRATIDHMPTVDAEPVRHGHWDDMGDFEQCSVCHGTHLKVYQTCYGKMTWVNMSYCPNCGAKMDEK